MQWCCASARSWTRGYSRPHLPACTSKGPIKRSQASHRTGPGLEHVLSASKQQTVQPCSSTRFHLPITRHFCRGAAVKQVACSACHLEPGWLSRVGRKGRWSRWATSSEGVRMALRLPPQLTSPKLLQGNSSACCSPAQTSSASGSCAAHCEQFSLLEMRARGPQVTAARDKPQALTSKISACCSLVTPATSLEPCTMHCVENSCTQAPRSAHLICSVGK